MRVALTVSIVAHVLLILAVIYSTELSLQFLTKMRKLETHGEIVVDLTYKPTDTPMKFGEDKRDLPPPMVQPKVEEETSKLKEKKHKTEKTKETKPVEKKSKFKSIMDKLRREAAKEDDRPPPKEKNFPMNKQGQKGEHGTGGQALRQATPSEQALQSAMRRHFELENANAFRKQNPNALGYISVKLAGVGNQLKIVSLSVLQTTGFSILDRKCQFAIREALDAETFASDIIQDLNGKETYITCQP